MPGTSSPAPLGRRQSLIVFACFAAAYFFSYGLRSVNAAIAPFITQDLGVTSAQLGWLSSAFFIAMAAMQPPLGVWLDRYGARRVEAVLLAVAALGSLLMVVADAFMLVSLGRILIGVGVAASLMAPFSYFRRCYPSGRQPQLALWTMVAGTAGAVFFTSPAAWLAGHYGWRSVHLVSGLSFAVVAALLWRMVPDRDLDVASGTKSAGASAFWELLRHPEMRRVMPPSIIGQGAAIALYTLWAGPWLIDVLGMSTARSASTLLLIMSTMMAGYVVMGLASPPLQRRFGLDRVALAGYAVCIAATFLLALYPAPGAWMLWLLMALGTAPVALMQPYVSMQFPREVAGRVVTLYNMFVFIGAFLIQWGIGVAVDGLRAAGLSSVLAYSWTFAGVGVLQAVSVLWWCLRAPARR
ncbi:putative glucarate transporter [Pigmentiphaga humi]|uniref:Putative glucarate transporter n=1 Tax=Pigmentiphaga humi TaxID=2478468 RepID=A0A3P4B3D0_9BURK|nr:MFS transporter [Pigmentiphaga humi]VCU70799.1 putative glucarate transporter [Pigmentiphaga humi]